MPILSSTAGRSPWCVSLEQIYLGSWQVDLELWVCCSWGGVTPWTKPCWFLSLWAHFGLRSLRDPSQPQPFWDIFDFEAVEVWFWSLIFYWTFLKAIKLFCTAALRRKIPNELYAFVHFILKICVILIIPKSLRFSLLPVSTQPGKNKAGDQLEKDFFLFLVPELWWQKPYFKPWKLFPVEASGSLALAASKLKLFS